MSDIMLDKNTHDLLIENNTIRLTLIMVMVIINYGSISKNKMHETETVCNNKNKSN